ncbi:MAG TPA: folylpolyglutamate synthase/dihydrofolate synthase family protein [Actinomycetota bacterium]|nr:folylpolyglutamate synthase/dihydrofolate synthase family protein [Actinomycetota bacterium]
MSYSEAVAHLDALGVDAMKAMSPSLDRMRALCDAMGNPQHQFPSIHITGTNGKTSVARITTSLVQELGLTVGTFTSPHLHTVRERIALGGEPVTEAVFGDAFAHLKPYLDHVENKLDEPLTYFEVLTGMFFLWASDQPVDVAVVEVGLGGMWDATNVMDGSIAVLTNIDLDHTSMLGMDRLTIAKEKVGIIKDGSTVVTGERLVDVLKEISDAADAAKASLSVLDRDFGLVENRLAVDGRLISVRTHARDYDDVFLPLHGVHQGTNAAISLEAVTSFLPEESLEDDVVAAGLANAQVPGRMERINKVLFDVAHNPSGMSAFVTSIQEEFAPEEAIFVVGFLSDKDYKGMLREIARTPCRRLIATRPDSPRAVDPKEVQTFAEELEFECSVEENVAAALDAAVAQAEGQRLVSVTGSHYVVGEAREYWLKATN